MRVMRLVVMMLGALVAMSLLVAASASAAESTNPLFTPANNQTVRGIGLGGSTLKAAGIEISCKENQVVSGNVSSGLLVGGIVIHYLGCTVPKGEVGAATGCEADSTGQKGGLILTNTLHAILGIELPANRTVLVFLPVTGTKFVTFIESENSNHEKCSVETAVTGTVAGLVEPAGAGARLTGKVLLGGPGVLVHLTHSLGLITTKLVAFSATGELEQSEDVTFGELTEVT